jgi:malate dehydrogenase
MVEGIAKNSGRVLPCAVRLSGEYGLSDLFIGVPVRLGRNGVEEIIEVDLNDAERKLMEASAEHVRNNLEALERLRSA